MIEILLPLRNPDDVLIRTVDSVIRQEQRSFSVLLSDNHSSSGQILIERALQKLTEAGLDVRLVHPPMELQRVEHWNWLHFQTQATWLKPLFAGDWLEPEYIAVVQQEIDKNPQCSYIYGSFMRHHGAGKPAKEVHVAWTERYYPPAEMQQKVLRFGMQFGPPSVTVYRRDAYLAMGGYRTTLPICADSLFFCTLAARFGGMGIFRPLSNFNLHDARFSMTLPGKLGLVFSEKITVIAILTYHAFTERISLPLWGILRLIAREIRHRLREKTHQTTS